MSAPETWLTARRMRGYAKVSELLRRAAESEECRRRRTQTLATADVWRGTEGRTTRGTDAHTGWPRVSCSTAAFVRRSRRGGLRSSVTYPCRDLITIQPT
jgi:hypothetical protein